MVLDWARRLQAALKALPDRPRRLLVLINPFGGAREARQTWEHKAAPIFDHAGTHPPLCAAHVPVPCAVYLSPVGPLA